MCMKKFTHYILSIFCILTAVTFFACNEPKSLKFENNYIEMSIGDDFDISSILQVENIDRQDVSYTVYDSSIISLEGTTITALSAGKTFVEASFENNVANLEVNVIGESIQAPTVNGLTYNTNSKTVVWDNALIKTQNSLLIANSYTVKIDDGESSEEFVTYTNSYAFNTNGEYSISVKVNDFISNGHIVYKGSAYCSPIEVEILPSPTSVVFDDLTSTLSWSYDNTDAQFKVIVNGLESEIISQTSYKLDLTGQNINSQTIYDVSVVSTKQNSDDKILVEGSSGVKTYTRLYAPTLEIQNGIVVWDNSQTGNFHYELTWTDTTGNKNSQTVSGGSFALDNIPAGVYSISISAISDDEAFLSSKNTSEITQVEKLSIPVINFDPVTRQISVVDHEDRNIKLAITFAGQTENVTLVDGVYTFDKTQAGQYQIVAYQEARENENKLNSDASTPLNIIQLAGVDLASVIQKVENGKYYIDFDRDDENTYALSYIDGDQEFALNQSQDKSYAVVDEVFDEVKEYPIVITESRNNSTGNTYYLPSKTTVYVERQANLTLSGNPQTQPTVISWQVLGYASEYEYYITKNGENFASGTTKLTNLELPTLEYGNYIVYVKAKGANVAGKLYLDSLSYAELAFDVVMTLDAPVVEFDRETHIVTIHKVANATSYYISLNETQKQAQDNGETLTLNLTNELSNAGSYILKVLAQNENALILDSSESTLNIVKLQAPQTYTISPNGTISVEINGNEQYLSPSRYEIWVGEQMTNLIGQENEYVVKGKFVSTDQQVENTYYLDSDFTEFTVKRLSSPSNLVLKNVNLSWDTCDNENFEYLITFTQDELTQLYTTSSSDVNVMQALIGSHINTHEDFYANVTYSFKGQSFDVEENLVVDYTSQPSEDVLIHRLSSDINVSVTEDQGQVTMSWDQSEIDGTIYEIMFDSDTISRQTQNSIDITQYVSTPGVHSFILQASCDGYVTSDYITVQVERLENVSQITIDEQENILINTDYQVGTEIESVQIQVDGQDVTNVKGHDGEFTVYTKLIANKNTQDNYFYLDSAVNSYMFERVRPLAAPLFSQDGLMYWDNISGINTYILKISADTEQTLQLQQSSIDINDTTIKDIVSILGGYEFNVSVMAYVGQFNISNGEKHLLSSSYSQNSKFFKLQAPNSVTVSPYDEDFRQQVIKASWSYNSTGVNLGGFEVVVHLEGVLTPNTLTVAADSTSAQINFAQGSGKYTLYVTAKGTSNYMDSDASDAVSFTRLDAPTNKSIDQNAVLNFTGTNLSEGYVITYTNNGAVSGRVDSANTTVDLKSYLYSSAFSGEIYINVYATGNGATTFTSAFEETLIATKAPAGEIQLFVDKLVAGGSIQDAHSYEYNITITQNNRVVKQLELNYADEYVFEDFVYQDNGQSVDTTKDTDYVITITRSLNGNNYIASDQVTYNFTKLASVQNLGFVRENESFDSIISFRADAVSNASGYVLTIADHVITDFIYDNGYIKVDLDNQVYPYIDSNFTFQIYAQGIIDNTGSGTNYINSSTTQISGTKLSPVTNFKTVNGVLTWDKVDLAYDYAIKDDTYLYTGYVTNGVHTTQESLTGRSGALSLNIKAVGNVGTTLLTSNIVLDSTYILDEYNNLLNYECTKLEKVSSLAATSGYISFAKLADENVIYQAVTNSGGPFELSEEVIDDTLQDISTFYSDEMYNSLATDTIYTLRIVATSNQEDIIYSDPSDAIEIRILNSNISNLRVELKQLRTDPDGTIVYDYTQSSLKWDNPNSGNYSYAIDINGNAIIETNTEFLLTNNEKYQFGVGSYVVRVAVIGISDDQSNVYSLISKFSPSIIFTKLASPTPSISEGLLAWTSVAGAGGYIIRLYQNGDIQFQSDVINSASYFLDMSGSSNITYDRYDVIAVPYANTNFIASDAATYVDDEANAKPVVKLSPTDMLTVQNGALTWNVDWGWEDIGIYLDLLAEEDVEEPFTLSMASLQNLSDRITLRFEGVGGSYTFVDTAAAYCLLSDDMKNLVGSVAPGLEPLLTSLEFYGWPSLNNNSTDFGSAMNAGYYSLYVNQVGDSNKYLTSNYGSGMQVYIPYAPVVKLVYTNSSYELQWDRITIPSQYYDQAVRYIVYGLQQVTNEDGETITKRVMLTSEDGITDTYFNLSNLIENDTLDSSFTGFAVYVRGDNSVVLNGKVSNIINVEILDDTKAYVRNGELYWNSQQSATSYIVYYTESTNPDNPPKSVVLTQAHWDAQELDSNIPYYNISIQAIGDGASSTIAVLTGKNTPVGKLSKLPSPNPEVTNGVFRWQQVDNSTSYNINVTGEINEVAAIANSTDSENYIYYQSNFPQQNLGYGMVAVGDLNVDLSIDGDIAYVNSAPSQTIYATLIPTVQNVSAINGQLSWDKVINSNVVVSNYKLTLQKVNDEGTPLDSEIIVESNYSGPNNTGVFDCAILEAGRYTVVVQGYFETTSSAGDDSGRYIYNGQTAYYLMGLMSQQYTFEKFDTVIGYDETGLVDNIVIHDGVLSWQYAGDNDESIYEYELRFTTPNETFSVRIEDESYSGHIVDQLIVPGSIELEIRVVAKQGVAGQGYVNSDYKKFINIHHDSSPYIYQLDGLSEHDIILGRVGDSEDLHILWQDYIPSVNGLAADINVQYLVTYYTSLDPTEHSIVVDTQYISTAEFNFSIGDEYTLYYYITVLPIGNQSYVASYPSEVRAIQKPESVSEVTYNSTEKYFTWATDGTSQDHVFKIKDEVLAVNENGEIIYENGQPVVVRTYIFTTDSNTTNIYYPVEMGAHKVSVAVVVRNSGMDGSLTSDYTYYYDRINEPENQNVGTIVLVDLFKVTSVSQDVYGGMGTSENPYLIETTQHFANISYRLSKPDYQNSYTLTIGDVDTAVTLSGEDLYLHFKQVADLNDVAPLGNGVVTEFSGIYDGDMHSISWNFDLGNISTAQNTRQYVALFGRVGENAAISNLRVYVTLQGQTITGSTVSLLCYENYGTINNIVLGAVNSTIQIETLHNISVYGIAYTNDGDISSVANYYNVDLRNTTSSVGTFANFALVGTNRGSVVCAANYGDVSLVTTRTNSAGIVATNNGTVQRSVFSGDATLSMAKDSRSDINFMFGGIVATNTSGTISYTYTQSNFNISRSAQSLNTYIYIAGLVASSNNGNISSSYVNVNISATSTIGQIDYIATFVANISSVSNPTTTETTTNFSNQSTYSSVLGLGASNFAVAQYTTVPSGLRLNADQAYFTNNENDFPVLRWESEFNSLWQL